MRSISVLLLCLVAGSVLALGQSSASPGEPALVVPDWCRVLPRPAYKMLERVPVKDPWYEVYRVAPGVLAIYEPHQWEETLIYLVEGKNRALLLDTGVGIGDLKRLVGELTTLPIVVVNSHTHTDHTGGNWQFSSIDSMDSEYTRDHARGSTEVREELEPGKICGALPSYFNAATFATRPWRPSRWLHDNDTIDLGGRTLRVIATPGHAPDALCLFDEANGLLFTGDTYYPGPIYVFGPGSDAAAYRRSVDRLAALAPKVHLVLGGHNAPVAPPSILPELAKEFAAVQDGKLAGKSVGGGVMEFKGDQIDFMVGKPQ